MPRKPQFGRIYRRKKRLPDGDLAELKTWTIEYYVNGKQIRESSKSKRYKDAEALLRKRILEIDTGAYAGPSAQRVLVSELLDDRLKHYQRHYPKSLEWAEIVDGHLRPFFRDIRAAVLGTSHIDTYIAHRREQGVSNSTINRELAQLRRAFPLGREYVPPKVVLIPRIPHLPEAPPRQGFFEYPEFVALRSELPESLRPIITFGYLTGCRKGEIIRLRWDQFDLSERIVDLGPDQTKNGEPRTLPLFGELYEMILMISERRQHYWPQCEWVFTRDGRERIRDFRDAWEEAAKRAAMRESDPVKSLWDFSRNKPAKLFHDLRRTGVRNLVRAGVPEAVAMRISGHKTRSVFERYNIVSTRDLHEAAAKLERHISELENARDKDTLRTPRRISDGTMANEARKLLN